MLDVEAGGGGVGIGDGVTVGRTVEVTRTVGVAIGGGVFPAPCGVPVAVAVEGVSTLGCAPTPTATGFDASSDALAPIAMSARQPPKPRSSERPIAPRIQGSAELAPPGGLPAKVVGGGVPSGAPHERQ